MEVARVLVQDTSHFSSIVGFNELELGARLNTPIAPTVDFVKDRFHVKVATSDQEREEAYRLRHKVFYQEFSQAVSTEEVDCDRYDEIADLLIIKDLKLNSLIGTYRIIDSQVSTDFYSTSEFHLQDFLGEPGRKVELSRACIHPAHRTGRVITLLWKGLHQYFSTSGARYLFGCSSITEASALQIAGIQGYLEQRGAISRRYDIKPRSSYLRANDDLPRGFGDSFDERSLPPLLRAYLKMGAKVAATPAYDSFFSCYDFFTIFDRNEMNETYMSKLGKK